MVFLSDANSFALLAFFGIGPYMAWLFLILAVIMLGPFYFWLLKFSVLIILALIIWPFWRATLPHLLPSLLALSNGTCFYFKSFPFPQPKKSFNCFLPLERLKVNSRTRGEKELVTKY